MRHSFSQLLIALGVFAGVIFASSPSRDFQNRSGGVAQYAYSLARSQSLSQTTQALTSWNSYIAGRSQWSLSASLITRLANADWNARQGHSPFVTSQQLANATDALLANITSTMTPAQEQAAWQRMTTVDTPNGRLGVNYKYPYVTVAPGPNPSASWVVAISSEAFTARKQDFINLGGSATFSSSSTTAFYPAEAMVVFYSVASGDMGYGGNFIANMSQQLASMTGLNMTGQYLFGDQGYLVRRPLSTYLTSQVMAQFFTALGF
jgi:hypothetical protein